MGKGCVFSGSRLKDRRGEDVGLAWRLLELKTSHQFNLLDLWDLPNSILSVAANFLLFDFLNCSGWSLQALAVHVHPFTALPKYVGS
jgi:hypothetical protein